MKAANLSGTWSSKYTYRSGEDGQVLTGEHHVMFKHIRDELFVGTSVPNADKSKLTLRLSYDAENKALTGTWQEVTSPTGYYQGAAFRGAVQFILNTDLTVAGGRWVGFNSSKTRVNTGEWTLIKQP
ncbi:MAG: putative DNA-binding protein [Candidatus Saccharibacteria bacterium]|nr:putative DNA-binding protein [Candidatus Saccharibacteria bacterium]